MDRFGNVYWSSDYTTGIESLSAQSNGSLKQLHELRQLVFKYMNYYHANSQFMGTFAAETANTSLKEKKGVVEKKTQLFQRRTISSNHRKLNDLKSGIGETDERGERDERGEKNSKGVSTETKDGYKDVVEEGGEGGKKFTSDRVTTMDEPVSMYVQEMSSESTLLMTLASTIDRQVLEDINDFIRHHEPSIRNNIDRLNDLVQDYITTYADIEKLKTSYSECQRAKEFADNEHAVKLVAEAEKEMEGDTSIGSVVEETSFTDSPKLQVSSPDVSGSTNGNGSTDVSTDVSTDGVAGTSGASDVESDTESSEFDFPLFLGPAKLKSQRELSAFLEDAVSRVETTKRSFPLPGQKPDIFSSDELCRFLVYRRPFKINPTRLNLERFGQSLLDLNLISGTSLIGSKKFKSENMWFEWSDLAIYISDYTKGNNGTNGTIGTTTKQETPISSPNTTPLKQRLMDQKAMNEMANQTSKKFNHMFKSMKLSIMQTNFEEKLVKIEQEYNEKYYDLHELKYLLDHEILDKTQYFEKFEKMKIGLIYQSLTKLSEIVYNFSLHSTTRLHEFASTLMKSVNNPANYENDFKKLIETFSTGIYSPSILSPENFQKNHYSTTQANNNFQNLKLQFNLYKDIPLQLQMRQTDKETHLLSFSSLPFFIYQFTKLLENKETKPQALQDTWTGPINHQSYWKIKEKIIKSINSTSVDHVTVSNESSIQQIMIENIVELLDSESVDVLVNFFKNWLLEIADSLIPCSIYDSLIQIYTNTEPTKSTVSELTKVLSSIPRSNIISLLFILEHISVTFSLSQIPSFGLSDDFPSELKSPVDKRKLESTAQILNTMETIGTVPFIHLIFRPSPIKSAGGLKPPISSYNLLLTDLLNLDVRCELFNNLVNSEKIVIEKKQQEKNNLGLQKKIPPSPRRPPVSVNNMKSPMALSLAPSDSFSLRPFHTKNTPAPSPSASPVNVSRELFENRSSSGPTSGLTPKQRERTGSGTFLAPAIDIEFEQS